MKEEDTAKYYVVGVLRIVLSMALLQLIGAVISVVLKPHHFWFMNLWLGGVVATIPGILIGLAWQIKASKHRAVWFGVAAFLVLPALGVNLLAFGIMVPRMKDEMRRLEGLAQLQHRDIRSIDVYDRRGRAHITMFTDADVIAGFVEGVADAVGHSPNHPRYSHSWYIVLEGDERHEFTLHLNPRFPQSVIGGFLTKSGNLTRYHGSFQSRTLRPWVEAHLLGEDGGRPE